eukprot:6193801-Pleurochrysis_carterae.AAC.1
MSLLPCLDLRSGAPERITVKASIEMGAVDVDCHTAPAFARAECAAAAAVAASTTSAPSPLPELCHVTTTTGTSPSAGSPASSCVHTSAATTPIAGLHFSSAVDTRTSCSSDAFHTEWCLSTSKSPIMVCTKLSSSVAALCASEIAAVSSRSFRSQRLRASSTCTKE